MTTPKLFFFVLLVWKKIRCVQPFKFCGTLLIKKWNIYGTHFDLLENILFQKQRIFLHKWLVGGTFVRRNTGWETLHIQINESNVARVCTNARGDRTKLWRNLYSVRFFGTHKELDLMRKWMTYIRDAQLKSHGENGGPKQIFPFISKGPNWYAFAI